MSLSLTLTEAIDNVMETFITRVSTKYNLDISELTVLWKGEYNKTVDIKPVQEIKDTEISKDVLLKCNKAELVALCKTNGHKCSGSKSILINRLLGKELTDDNAKTSKPESKSNRINKVSHLKDTPVVKKLTANIPNILIRRNQYNNYEHPETGLVFNNETKVVIGKQNSDGSIDPLTEEDIDKCNAFKFKFNIPSNLDYKSTLKEVKIDELSEEEDEEELQVEEEDEEEEFEEEEFEEEEFEEEFEDYVSDED